MNNLLEKLKPKEDKFFLMLKEMGAIIVSVSDLAVKCVQAASHEEAVELYRQVKEQEQAADLVQTRIFEALNNTFITPFDREDIGQISSTLDDVVDLVNSCAKRITLYKPKALPASAVELAKLVHESAGYLAQALDELDSFKKRPEKIKEYSAQLVTVERKADDVYEEFIIDLFEHEKDAIEVIKLKEILHELERATDAERAVGKIIRTVIIKYS
ncbi:hypothetical protein Barb6_00670 [Bacteroidales bacterium Barb6]|nr:hypothetical protein Barb6XT_02564 [Bacteroidales bacterium Barb6XT]OAV68243.1 hypothetical protein Barb4_02144 [Bacteroidales bacterium Barb4]OAV72948.1 hypothetical protein Barb6_00670 [Bacteroidales bacterium Barb6]OAV75627.1 hypothetical protein Barb7_00745 [Bacteroidales bacterium Barb7]